MNDTTPLPNTVEQCHEYIGALAAQLAERDAEIAMRESQIAAHESQIAEQENLIAQRETEIAQRETEIAQRNAELAEREALIAKLQKQLFGRRSEKSQDAPPSEATPQEIAEEATVPREKRRDRTGSGRKPLPEYLPREQNVVDVADDAKLCPCCGRPMKCIGEDASEQLDVRPAEFFVRRTVRPRYACGACRDRVVQAPLPPQTLPRTGATAGLAAHLMLWKYEDHLPLNRLERIFTRGGIDLDRARMCDWLLSCAELLDPLVKLMQRRILESGRACADETPLQMQAPGRTKRCWLWVSRGLEDAPYTVFRFSESRGAAGLIDEFKSFEGALLTDAYAAYDKLAREHPRIELHGCWAHARRKFVEAADAGDKTAQEAIDLIGALYAIEREGENLTHEERRDLRRAKSTAQLAKIEAWLHAHSDSVPKSPLGKAVAYTLDRWTCLVRYVEDGAMPIDNNAIERSIRPVAVGRKNWLFAGSPRGGHAAATFFTLLESCRRSGHNTFEYVSDILARVAQHPVNQLEELLPDRWTPPPRPA